MKRQSEACVVGKFDGQCFGNAVRREGANTSGTFFFHKAALASWDSAPVGNRSHASRSEYVTAFKAAAGVKAA